MMNKKVIDQIAGVKDDVDKRVNDTVSDIVSFAWAYKYKGKAFTYDVSKTLEYLANQKAGELYDALVDDNDARVDLSYGYANTLEYAEDMWDRDHMYDYVDRELKGKTRKDRYHNYCDMLTRTVEAWVAIGFARGLSQWEVESKIINGDNRLLWDEKRDGGYSIDLGDKSLSRNIPMWMTLIGQQAVTDAYHFGIFGGYHANPNIIGYRVLRGSSYPCALCDELTHIIHPLDDIVVPAHPRCVCYTQPVYKDGEIL